MTGGSSGRDREAMRAELHRPFRPRWGRLVPWAVAAAGAAAFVAVALLYPGATLADQLSFLALAAVLVLLLSRFAGVRADPTEASFTVRNLVTVRSFAWPQIVTVTFGRGNPWAYLDLADGTTVPVMAIQAADGNRGRREADRLATLVELHGREITG